MFLTASSNDTQASATYQAPAGAGDILALVGEVAYRWAIGSDTLTWEGDVEAVLGIAAPALATGRAFATLLDPENVSGRYDAVFGGSASDRGGGVAYQAEYALRPGGAAGPVLWVEDCGRWFGDGGTRPARAHGVMRLINDRRERDKRLAFRSRHDELTGFFNRAHLIDLIGESLETTQRFRNSAAFLLIAVDNFRVINESYGYETADQVLAAVARRVRSRLRGADTIGRFSGNKIGVLLSDADEITMRAAADRFLAAVRDEVVATDNGAIAVSASIGGVVLPRNGRTVGEVVSRAEEGLHVARSDGQARFSSYVYSTAREEARKANAALSVELINGLKENRIRLAFQPVVDILTRKPAFHEALLRLVRPDGEIVPASVFIPLSERLGLVRLLDQRALELAIEALVAAPTAKLSLNVTADTAGGPSWLAHLRKAAAAHPGLAERLIVEITESSAIRSVDAAKAFIAAIRDLGCSVAMDDFGAGQTSFRNLRLLDLDIVKIDGAFVQNLAASTDDQVFVRALLELAANFGLRTVAEWVQDEESADILRAWGITYLQGELTGVAVMDWPPRG